MKTHLEVLDLLFPKARAEILRLLFSGPKARRYVRELMLMSGLALRTVQEGAGHFDNHPPGRELV
jgi:hypothetical protein